MKGGKVVCNIYGYPENNGFGNFFNDSNVNEDYTILNAVDQDIFDVGKREEVVYLVADR